MCANRPIPPENMLAPIETAVPPDWEERNHETHEAHESPAPVPAPNGYDVALDVLRVALRPDVSAEERRSLVLACRAYLRKKSHRRHWKANRAGEGARNA